MTYQPVPATDDNFGEIRALADETPSGGQILAVCLGVTKFLLEKNRAYGDSALSPMRVFSTADAAEQIRVRMDDKLSRLARGSLAGEDAELDLLGYLILLRVQQYQQNEG